MVEKPDSKLFTFELDFKKVRINTLRMFIKGPISLLIIEFKGQFFFGCMATNESVRLYRAKWVMDIFAPRALWPVHTSVHKP